MLEHLRCEHVPTFLDECRRVLKPGGVVRISVPDLEEICRIYLQRLDAAATGDRSAEKDHEWMTIELLDQAVRERSGGRMMQYLQQNPLINESFVLERIGEEGKSLLQLLRQPQTFPAKQTPPATSSLFRRSVRYLKLGIRRRILSWLVGDDADQALAIGRFRLGGEAHHWMYDRVSLSRRLLEAGFVEPQRQNAGTSRIGAWSRYNLDTLLDGRAIKPDLFHMEAIKP
jgi:hypothetical protein